MAKKMMVANQTIHAGTPANPIVVAKGREFDPANVGITDAELEGLVERGVVVDLSEKSAAQPTDKPDVKGPPGGPSVAPG